MIPGGDTALNQFKEIVWSISYLENIWNVISYKTTLNIVIIKCSFTLCDKVNYVLIPFIASKTITNSLRLLV